MTNGKGCYRAFDATMDAIAIKLLTAALRLTPVVLPIFVIAPKQTFVAKL